MMYFPLTEVDSEVNKEGHLGVKACASCSKTTSQKTIFSLAL